MSNCNCHSHKHHDECCNHHENHKLEIIKLVISTILFILSFIFKKYSLYLIIISYVIMLPI